MDNRFNINKRLNHSYITGILLGVNAIPDSCVIIDSPDCIINLAQSIYINHDTFSTLLKEESSNRIISTATNVKLIHQDRSKEIIDKINKVFEIPDFNTIFFTSMPINNIVGTDYSLILERLNHQQKRLGIIEIPGKSLTRDWIDGYHDLLFHLADSLYLKKNQHSKDTIGIIGYLFERNEGDNFGDIQELRRLCNRLEINISSIWLEGKSSDYLNKIDQASLIICFPGYKKVAQKVAQKTGAKVLLLDLPFGITATKIFLEKVASFFSKKDVHKVIDEELSDIVPLVTDISGQVLSEIDISFFGEPYLGTAICKELFDLGVQINDLVLFSRERKELVDSLSFDDLSSIKTNIQFEPKTSELIVSSSDLYIGNSIAINYVASDKHVSFGYPSLDKHYFFSHPKLGFKGIVIFINMLYNQLRSSKR